MKFLLEQKGKKVDFQIEAAQGPHWTSGNSASVFPSSCQIGRIFSCISSTPGLCCSPPPQPLSQVCVMIFIPAEQFQKEKTMD